MAWRKHNLKNTSQAAHESHSRPRTGLERGKRRGNSDNLSRMGRELPPRPKKGQKWLGESIICRILFPACFPFRRLFSSHFWPVFRFGGYFRAIFGLFSVWEAIHELLDWNSWNYAFSKPFLTCFRSGRRFLGRLARIIRTFSSPNHFWPVFGLGNDS